MNDTIEKPRIAIISACLSHLTPGENTVRTLQLRDYLRIRLTDAWKFAPVKGCYKGTEEVSFKVNIDDPKDERVVNRAAKKFKQESYLIINSKRVALLHFTKSGEITPLGYLVSASETEAKRQDGWTYDPETETYFIISPETETYLIIRR